MQRMDIEPILCICIKLSVLMLALADLRVYVGSKVFQFHAVYGQIHMLAPPGGLTSYLIKILYLPLVSVNEA